MTQLLARAINQMSRPACEAGFVQNLFLALRFLGQRPPQELRGEEPRTVVQWGIANWKVENIPRDNTPVPSD